MSDPKNTDFNFLELSDKNLKDVKFSAAGFVVLCIILSHYAWTMRQMVLYRDLSYTRLTIYFVSVAITAVVTLTVLMKVVYTKIYAAELAQEKVEKEKAKQE